MTEMMNKMIYNNQEWSDGHGLCVKQYLYDHLFKILN